MAVGGLFKYAFDQKFHTITRANMKTSIGNQFGVSSYRNKDKTFKYLFRLFYLTKSLPICSQSTDLIHFIRSRAGSISVRFISTYVGGVAIVSLRPGGANRGSPENSQNSTRDVETPHFLHRKPLEKIICIVTKLKSRVFFRPRSHLHTHTCTHAIFMTVRHLHAPVDVSF